MQEATAPFSEYLLLKQFLWWFTQKVWETPWEKGQREQREQNAFQYIGNKQRCLNNGIIFIKTSFFVFSWNGWNFLQYHCNFEIFQPVWEISFCHNISFKKWTHDTVSRTLARKCAKYMVYVIQEVRFHHLIGPLTLKVMVSIKCLSPCVKWSLYIKTGSHSNRYTLVQTQDIGLDAQMTGWNSEKMITVAPSGLKLYKTPVFIYACTHTFLRSGAPL